MVHCATEPGACALSQDAVEASEDGTRTCAAAELHRVHRARSATTTRTHRVVVVRTSPHQQIKGSRALLSRVFLTRRGSPRRVASAAPLRARQRRCEPSPSLAPPRAGSAR